MRKLLLKDILKQFEQIEKVVGHKNLIIQQVVARPYHLGDNTLFFERRRRNVDWKQCKEYQPAAIVSENIDYFKPLEENCTLIQVKNVEEAYFQFIHYYRSLFNQPVVVVTGTCGKTTTKEMIRHILLEHYNVQATFRSKNASRLNLPYLLGIDDTTQAAVFEAGVADPGDLLDSCRYFEPDIGVITNIGVDHLKGCKNIEGYIKAKSELIEGLKYKGTLILNSDDENIKKIDLTSYQGQVITFGTGEHCDWRADDIRYGKGGMHFTLYYANLPHEIFVPGYGEPNVYNALAALATVQRLGFGIKEAAQRLATFEHIYGHFEVIPGIKGCTVIDDTWNSNPTSVVASLRSLLGFAGRRNKTIAVIGRMSALGEAEQEWHSWVGKNVASTGVDILITIGDVAQVIGTSAIEAGMKEKNVYLCKDSREAFKILDDLLNHRSIVLLKTKSSMSDTPEVLIDKLTKR